MGQSRRQFDGLQRGGHECVIVDAFHIGGHPNLMNRGPVESPGVDGLHRGGEYHGVHVLLHEEGLLVDGGHGVGLSPVCHGGGDGDQRVVVIDGVEEPGLSYLVFDSGYG